MKIIDHDVFVLSTDTGRQSLPTGTAEIDVDITAVLVCLNTAEGATGLGETFTHSAATEDAEALARRINALVGEIIDEDARNVRNLWHTLYEHTKRSGAYDALSAIDQALWDLAAKAAGVPLYRFLGGTSGPLRTYATFPKAKETDELIAVGERLADRGFDAMKIVVGSGVDTDRERIRRIAPELPDGFGLALDANTAYDLPDAVAIAQTAAEHDLRWFEEPIAHTDVQGIAELRRRTSVPIAGYQTHTPHYPAVDHLRAGAYDIYQPAIYHVGGITPATNISALVEAFNREFVPHAVGPAISYGAALHVAAASPSCSLIEFAIFDESIADLGQFVASPYVTDPSKLRVDSDGRITPPTEPGLGIEIDNDALQACRIDSV